MMSPVTDRYKSESVGTLLSLLNSLCMSFDNSLMSTGYYELNFLDKRFLGG